MASKVTAEDTDNVIYKMDFSWVKWNSLESSQLLKHIEPGYFFFSMTTTTIKRYSLENHLQGIDTKLNSISIYGYMNLTQLTY